MKNLNKIWTLCLIGISCLFLSSQNLAAQEVQPEVNFRSMVIPSNALSPLLLAEPIPMVAEIESTAEPLPDGSSLQFLVENCVQDYVTTCDEFFNETKSITDIGTAPVFIQADAPFVNTKVEPFIYNAVFALDYSVGFKYAFTAFGYSDTIFSKDLITLGSIFEENKEEAFAPENTNGYAYGNVFYIPALGDGLLARYANFSVDNPQALAGQKVDILLYEWEGDTNEDDQVNPSEYDIVGKNSYVFSGMEEGDKLISVLVDQGGSVVLKGATQYLLAVRHAATGTLMQFNTSPYRDYSGTVKWTKLQGAPRYAAALDIGNTGNFTLSGDDVLKRVPILRLSIGDAAIVNNREVMLPDNAFQITPNPNRGKMDVKLHLESSTSKADLQLLDLNGRTIWQQTITQLGAQNLSVEPGVLSAGVYFLRLQTAEGMLSKKIIVQP